MKIFIIIGIVFASCTCVIAFDDDSPYTMISGDFFRDILHQRSGKIHQSARTLFEDFLKSIKLINNEISEEYFEYIMFEKGKDDIVYILYGSKKEERDRQHRVEIIRDYILFKKFENIRIEKIRDYVSKYSHEKKDEYFFLRPKDIIDIAMLAQYGKEHQFVGRSQNIKNIKNMFQDKNNNTSWIFLFQYLGFSHSRDDQFYLFHRKINDGDKYIITLCDVYENPLPKVFITKQLFTDFREIAKIINDNSLKLHFTLKDIFGENASLEDIHKVVLDSWSLLEMSPGSRILTVDFAHMRTLAEVKLSLSKVDKVSPVDIFLEKGRDGILKVKNKGEGYKEFLYKKDAIRDYRLHDEIMSEHKKIMQRLDHLIKRDHELCLNVKSNIYLHDITFDVGKSIIKRNQGENLDEFLKSITSLSSLSGCYGSGEIKIFILGNADDIPSRTQISNEQLSENRAHEVENYVKKYIDNFGKSLQEKIDNNIIVRSYGNTRRHEKVVEILVSSDENKIKARLSAWNQ